MPAWPALLAARRIPWRTLFIAGQQLYKRSRAFRDNLTDAERTKLGEILRKSKGRRSNLTDSDVAELRMVVIKGFRGERPS
ncbi:MAG: hypothetical protein M3331_01575 [Actinomycetota bacterium]|nr:hypothetical protein [Actinomycetota bacterium]